VAKRTEELGAGIRLPSIAEDDILNCLKQVLTVPDYKKNAIKVSESFHSCGGAAEARAFLEEVGGFSRS
jgi:UDP:flavonoid glycosyltransferase YjiC (YdhE family)